MIVFLPIPCFQTRTQYTDYSSYGRFEFRTDGISTKSVQLSEMVEGTQTLDANWRLFSKVLSWGRSQNNESISEVSSLEKSSVEVVTVTMPWKSMPDFMEQYILTGI